MDMEPPPPRPRAPPALPDEVVEEILLRSPPDHPAHLIRAALVCKRWCRLVSAGAVRRQFRARHAAPMLGFLFNDVSRAGSGDEALCARIVRTAASCPPLAARHGWHALDARVGRVLLHHRAAGAAQGIRLAVWDPLAAAAQHMVDLPSPTLSRRPRSWNAALLCDDDVDDPFIFSVVLVGTDAEGTFACVYSSSSPEAAAWTQPAYAPQQHPGGDHHVDAVRGALVGDALYFVCQRRTRVLRYDLATGAITVVSLPSASNNNQRIALTTTDAGGLGFGRMEGHRLGLWSSMDGGGGGAIEEWTRDRVIDLRTLLPIIDLLGFAHGIVLVGTVVDGFFTVDQKSGRITKLRNGPAFYNLVIYATIYTPALVTASTDEGSRGDG